MLFDHVLRCVEERGIRLQRFGLFPGLPQRQRGRGQEAGFGQPQIVGFVAIDRARRQRADAAAAGERRGFPALRRIQHFEPALDVVEHVEDEFVLRPGRAFERGRVAGREQHAEIALAGHEVVELRRDQRAGRIVVAADRPRFAQLQRQPFAMEVLARGVGSVDLGERAVRAAQEQFVVPERDGAVDEIALEARRAVAERADGEVVGLAFVHHRRRGHRRTARPQFGDARVARGRHRTRAEIGADIDVVAIDPAEVALGFGAEEAAFHPILRVEVEFAGDVGVAAAARQADQAALVMAVRLAQAVGAVPDPVFMLGRAKRVEVDHRFPARFGLAVFGQRGAPPQAALVLRVLPEVVVVVADLLDVRDLRLGIEDRLDLPLQRVETGRGREFGIGARVLFADPGQRFLAGHVLQPEIGIVGGGGHGGLLRGVGGERRRGGQPGHQHEEETGLAHGVFAFGWNPER